MAVMPLSIVGVCRFSYLGRGDWRALNDDRKGRTDAEILEENRKILFDPARLEKRFATFENLTLPSFACQTDSNFRLIVMTSEELPQPAATRLKDLAQKYPFLVLAFKPPGDNSKLIPEIYAEIGLPMAQILQFRIDDDDAVGNNYIERMRFLSGMAHTADPHRKFAITFPTTMGVLEVNEKLLFRTRHFMHTGAGQAMYHPNRCILEWAHHRVDRSMLTVADPDYWVMVTSLTGTNDSGAITDAVLRQRGYAEIADDRVDLVLSRRFPFITRTDPVWDTIRCLQRPGGGV